MSDAGALKASMGICVARRPAFPTLPVAVPLRSLLQSNQDCVVQLLFGPIPDSLSKMSVVRSARLRPSLHADDAVAQSLGRDSTLFV